MFVTTESSPVKEVRTSAQPQPGGAFKVWSKPMIFLKFVLETILFIMLTRLVGKRRMGPGFE
jgi:hypothetical protein